MEFVRSDFPGLIEIRSRHVPDRRGSFTKVFHRDLFEQAGIQFQLAEQYFSLSNKGVVRGMHFQLPPHDHAKIVFCPAGSVLDVVLDLRRGSPTFMKFASFELTESNARILYIPAGFAHGFAALADRSIMVYNVSTVYNSAHDTGIRWDSFGFSWPVERPVISDRDAALPPLAEFQSPFSL